MEAIDTWEFTKQREKQSSEANKELRSRYYPGETRLASYYFLNLKHGDSRPRSSGPLGVKGEQTAPQLVNPFAVQRYLSGNCATAASRNQGGGA